MQEAIHDGAAERPTLEFDTGLSAQAFAQAKLAQLVTASGWIIRGDGVPVPWKPVGVREQNGTMRIWGPAFTGEGLHILIADASRKDQALDALRRWIRARLVLDAQPNPPAPWPAGALAAPSGTLLFPPERLVKQSLEAAGRDAWLNGAEGYVHPDLSGVAATAFTAGAMLYRIYCGSPPFPNTNREVLHQDIREGFFVPPHLAVPGLDTDLAGLISRALTFLSPKQALSKGFNLAKIETEARGLLTALGDLLGSPGSAPAASFLHECTEAEQARLTLEKARFTKRHTRRVQAKRLVYRNKTLITGIAVAALILVLILWSLLVDRAKGPTTQGMSPQEVAETYYKAMGAMDHQLMDACVMPKGGTKALYKRDIDMVTHFFVISRVRQAYEQRIAVIPAQEWIDAGAPPTDATVFGVSELRLEGLDQDESDGEVSFDVSYRLWLPGSYRDTEDPGQAGTPREAPLPWSTAQKDRIRLIRSQDAWRIAEIQREMP
ncbi:MAG: hypothetical protein LBQ30_11130 [Treponema sp.]|jgi:hypothetical protein|nr:hypothetical protein [Treponema sp.]